MRLGSDSELFFSLQLGSDAEWMSLHCGSETTRNARPLRLKSNLDRPYAQRLDSDIGRPALFNAEATRHHRGLVALVPCLIGPPYTQSRS